MLCAWVLARNPCVLVDGGEGTVKIWLVVAVGVELRTDWYVFVAGGGRKHPVQQPLYN